MSTDIATNHAPPSLPRSVSSLRPGRPPKRVPTRISIVEPKSVSGPSNSRKHDGDVSATSRTSSVSPKLCVTSSPWSKKLILTLDGGGIRGYSSLIILRALMKEIREIEGKTGAASSAHTERIRVESIPDAVYKKGVYLPCHYFDYIAGTSFGGLIAIMLGMLGMSVDDCVEEFRIQNEAIPLANNIPNPIEFPLLNKRTTWPTKRSLSFFNTFARFSATATGSAKAPPMPATTATLTASSSSLSNASSEFKKDSLQCQTLAWCTEVEGRSRGPYAFCSYEESDQAAGDKMVSIPEVAKAITAPWNAWFKPFKLGSGQFVDGSRQIRDPTLEVLKEIKALLDSDSSCGGQQQQGSGNSEGPAIDLLLSLGTDEHQAWFYEKLRRGGSGGGNAGQDDGVGELSKEKDRSYKEYHRFEVPDVRLGLRRKNYLAEIEEATEKWLVGQQSQIRRYAEFLVKRRRERAGTTRWETFALGVRYICFHEECKKDREEMDSRGKFYDHLDRKHGLSRMDVNVEEELDKGRHFGCVSPS